MKVALLSLADYAVAADDGRIYMIGGAIDRLGASQFPALVTHLSLAVKFVLSTEERSQEHSVQVRLLDPEGNPVTAPMGLLIPVVPTTSPGNPIGSQDEAPYQFVYNMRDLRFESAGVYSFSVELDNQELGPLALRLEQTAIPSLSLRSQQDTLTNELASGYLLFARGNLAEALSAFERLIRLFPRSPDAHNNHAYVLLASGQPRPAMEGFERAIELRHSQLELVTANIACCQFLLGDFPTALESFKSLFRAALRSPQATLFGLGTDSMKPVFLFSQADYLALMQLNAGRCAERLNDSDEGRRYASIAELGMLTFRPESRTTFEALLDELKRDLSSAPTTARQLRKKPG